MRLKSMQMPTKDKTTGWLQAPGPKLTLNDEAVDRITNTLSQTASTMISGSAPEGTDVEAAKAERPRMEALKQAGPKLTDAFSSLIQVEGKISIRVGKMLYFPDVVIRNVSDQYTLTLGADGRPQKIGVTISAVTRLTPVLEDLLEIYGVDPSALEGK